MLACLLPLFLLFAPLTTQPQGIEGAAERYKFEPGDKVLYEANLAQCPVGEFLPEWRIARGSYECARFRDRIWIRPLEHETVLYLPLEPLPEAFSLEFTVYSFEKGRPLLKFGLHSREALQRLENGNYYAHDEFVLMGGVITVGDPSRFGAKDRSLGSLEGRWDFRQVLAPQQEHRIAVQVRRHQVRFFVDGQRVGHKPFRPELPLRVLSFYFRRVVEDPTPFRDAPVLVTDLRLATYTQKEAAPRAELDLIRALRAQETPEGLKVTLSEAILFDFGKWDLKPEARTVLRNLAQLARYRKGPIRIEGHTDNVGSAAYNQVLSELRAHVVALELARRGVDPNRLQPRGFGATRPVASNDTEAGRARNRRVEVIFVRP